MTEEVMDPGPGANAGRVADDETRARLQQLFRHADREPAARALRELICQHRGVAPESLQPPVQDAAVGAAEQAPAGMRLSEQTLHEALKRLPALPPLVADLLASFQQENLDVDTLARRIAADQGLLVRTLRVANSPFYGLAGQVMSIDEAIMVLGFRTVRSLVLGAAIVGAFDPARCRGFHAAMFWRHSVAVAVAGRALARRLRHNSESAFTAGLLHDIGRYVLALCFPQHYAAVLDWQRHTGCPHRDAEEAVLGLDHAHAGALLATTWGLPEALARAIGGHHQPADTPEADLVHLADVLVHALELGHEEDETVPPMNPDSFLRTGLQVAGLPPLLAEIQNEFEETCNALLS